MASDQQPNPERYYAVAGRLEIMDEPKDDTLLLQPRSDCDPDESPLPSGHDTIDLASIRKVSALSKAEVAEKRQKLADILNINGDDFTTEDAQRILDCALQYPY